MGKQRVAVKEAALLLGTSEHAIRQRIYRGTLDSEKVGGKVYVQLTETELHSDTHEMHSETHARDELVEELRATNGFLRQQLEAEREANRENRRLLAAALELAKRPAIESPEPRDDPENASEPRPGTEAPASDAGEPRPPWWRRFFGFE